jgi:hypothetical protein
MGRVSRFQREWTRERRRCGDGNLHRFFAQHLNKIDLSSARESQRVRLWLWAVMLGCWGCKWEKEWGGEVACGYLTGEAVSGGLQGRSWCPGRVLAGVGGGVSALGPGVHGARVFGRVRMDRGDEADMQFIQSRRHAGVRQRGRHCNRREGGSGCASGVLGWSRPCVRE